jgi:hypothetical protein
MKKIRLLLLAAVIVTFVTNCEKTDDSVTTDQQLATQLVSGSTDTLKSGGIKFILEVRLSRTFSQGGSASQASPMTAAISLVKLDSTSIGHDLDITKLYVIKDSQIWTTVPGSASSSAGYKLGKISTGGPEWGPNIFVNVVAEISNNSTGSKSQVIARNQNIFAIY